MAKVIGGDFKKNSNVKLIKRKGEIDALILSVGFMKKQLYVPKNIRSVTQEANINRNTILNVTFGDGKHVVLSARGKEAEKIIALGIAAERNKTDAFTKNASGNQPASQKTERASPAGAIVMLTVLAVVIPVLVATFTKGNSYLPIAIAGLIAALYLFCLWKPRPLPLGNKRWKSGVFVAILGVGIWMGVEEIRLQAHLDDLKTTDPAAYLAKLKDLRLDDKWLDELKHIDPPAYSKEMAFIEQRKLNREKAEREKIKKERLAAQKEAEEEAERERCGRDITAYSYATILIEKRLKNPDAADFHYMGARKTMLECGRWRIRSTFDGTNGFGATIRTNYMAIVRRAGEGHWVLEEFETW